MIREAAVWISSIWRNRGKKWAGHLLRWAQRPRCNHEAAIANADTTIRSWMHRAVKAEEKLSVAMREMRALWERIQRLEARMEAQGLNPAESELVAVRMPNGDLVPLAQWLDHNPAVKFPDFVAEGVFVDGKWVPTVPGTPEPTEIGYVGDDQS